MSFRQVQTTGTLLGHLIWRMFPSRRRIARLATGLHLGLEPSEAKALAKSSFMHSGKSFLDLFLCRKVDNRFVRDRISCQQPDQLQTMLRIQRPVVAVTAHFGAWEILAGLLGLYFQNRQAQIIVRDPKNQKLSYTLSHLRAHAGIDLIHNRQATFKVLRCLNNHGIAAFLVDHNCSRNKAVFLPFLQKFAAINIGPAVLAVRARAVVWPVFLARCSSGKYLLYNQDYLDTKHLGGNFGQKVEQVAEFYTRSVQDMVLRHPEQWFWMHKRWKTRPLWEKKKKPREAA